MSDVRRRHRRMKDAVEDGDVGRAIELRTELQERELPVDELLEEFRTAVREGTYDEAETVRHQIRERFATRRLEDKAAVQRSNRVRQDADLSSSNREALNGHVQSAIEMTAARSAFLTTSTLFFIEPAEVDDDDVIEQTEELEDSEREFQARQTEAETASDDVLVPATIELLGGDVDGGTIAVNSPTTVAVRVGNVGDESATDVSVAVESSDALSVTPAERALGDLAGEERTTVEFTVTGTEEGTHRFGVTATAETGGSSHTRLSLEVDTDGERSPLLEAFSGADGSVRFEDVVDAIARFNEGDPIPDTDDRVGFQDVLWIIEAFNRGA